MSSRIHGTHRNGTLPVLGAVVAGLFLACSLSGVAISTSGAAALAAPTHTITIVEGPDAFPDYPWEDGNGLAYEIKFKVDPPLVTPVVVDKLTHPGGSESSSCYEGGLNQGVGTVYLKASCLKKTEAVYTIHFLINNETHTVDVVNPRAKTSAIVDFGGATALSGDSGTFPVRVVNADKDFVSIYSDTVWITAFTLKGSRVQLQGSAAGWVAVDIVNGIGSLEITVQERVEDDTLILQIAGPRLDTTRSSINL